MIRTVAVVGAGLIGTSVGLALTRHGVTVHLLDLDGHTARIAASLGAGITDPPEGPVELAVLAVPPSQVGPVLLARQRAGLARAYTDVASVRAEPEQAVLRGGADRTTYLGGHPMAGRELSGPLAARADLFKDRTWVLTPSAETSSATLNRVLEVVSLCGAVPVVMDCELHDHAVALTSHVPHLLAALLAARLRDAPREVLRLVGQGLRDTTRIAGGDTRLWSDILRGNAAALAPVLAELAQDLDGLRATVDRLAAGQPGAGELEQLLDQGAQGLEAIRPWPGDPARHTSVQVALPDRPGELAGLLDVAAEFGADQGVRVEETSERDELLVELKVPAPDTEPLLRRLTADADYQAVRI